MVISGFSGAGKGTLVKKLLQNYDNYALSISMTTRKPREGERDGVEYFFVDREKFEKTIAENGLIEYATYCDNYYGTPRAYVEEQLAAGKDVILEIEIQGALQIKKKFPESLLLFVTPPCAEELRRRLEGRGKAWNLRPLRMPPIPFRTLWRRFRWLRKQGRRGLAGKGLWRLVGQNAPRYSTKAPKPLPLFLTLPPEQSVEQAAYAG